MTLRVIKHLAQTLPTIRDGVKLPRGKNVGFIDLVPLDSSVLSFGEAVGVGEFAPSNGVDMKLDFNLPVVDGFHGLLGHTIPVSSKFLTTDSSRGNVDTSVPIEDLSFNDE